MSIGRVEKTADEVRDVNGAYIDAYLAEYKSFIEHDDPRADEVADTLRQLGHEVERQPRPTEGTKERAVSPEPLETAVESDTPPKRRGRPRSTADAE